MVTRNIPLAAQWPVRGTWLGFGEPKSDDSTAGLDAEPQIKGEIGYTGIALLSLFPNLVFASVEGCVECRWHNSAAIGVGKLVAEKAR